MTPPSHPWVLRRLARTRPIVAFLVVLVVLLAGLLAPGIVGGALLMLLGAGLAALTRATWPVQQPGTRAVRVGMLAMLFTAAIVKIF